MRIVLPQGAQIFKGVNGVEIKCDSFVIDTDRYLGAGYVSLEVKDFPKDVIVISAHKCGKRADKFNESYDEPLLILNQRGTRFTGRWAWGSNGTKRATRTNAVIHTSPRFSKGWKKPKGVKGWHYGPNGKEIEGKSR